MIFRTPSLGFGDTSHTLRSESHSKMHLKILHVSGGHGFSKVELS